MQVFRTLTRFYVNDLPSAMALFEAVYGRRELEYRHPIYDLHVAVVGSALVIAGAAEELDKVRGAQAAIVVDDLDAALALGGSSERGIQEADGRRQATVTYAHGAVIEWIELT
ncbi:hypothetical protein AB0M12_26280 [Nocardia vinacea]|uniref:VOC family protein n=1 Tax=Nocardia vinacea TaxID=96468 RepID=UPI00341BF0A4